MQGNATLLRKRVQQRREGGITILGTTTFGEGKGSWPARSPLYYKSRRVQELRCMAGRHPPGAGRWGIDGE